MKPKGARPFFLRPSLEAVLECVLRIYGLREEDLSASGQKRLTSEAEPELAERVESVKRELQVSIFHA